jgi:monoamine oxidase
MQGLERREQPGKRVAWIQGALESGLRAARAIHEAPVAAAVS